MSTLRAASMALLTAALSLSAVPVRAQDGAPGEAYREGVEHRKQGRPEQALEAFRRAHEQSPSGRTLAQIGLAEQALGRWVDAHTHLSEALASGHEWVEQHRATLEEALDAVSQRVGRLDVRGGPEGAEVAFGGERVGTLPFDEPASVIAQSAELTVRAPGYATLRRSVTVPAGGLARESIEMERETEPSTASQRDEPRDEDAEGTGSGEERGAGAATAAAGSGPKDGGEADPLLRALGWTSLSAAALSIVGATVAWRIREGHAEDWNDDERCLRPGRTRGEVCGSDKDAAEAAELASIVQLVIGGALAATGAALLVLDAGGGETERARAVCGGGPGLVGARCEVRF